MYFRFLLYAFIIYLLYRLIFNFIIPVVKTTRHVKAQFRDIHRNMQDGMDQADFKNTSDEKKKKSSTNFSPKEPGGDYIEFEEVK